MKVFNFKNINTGRMPTPDSMLFVFYAIYYSNFPNVHIRYAWFLLVAFSP